ncbi:MAG: endoribonuclease MazF [Gloeomargaritaceae cyanobacterium C42_A2020_066]|nr:endoribonuclease MazF [Gloeomargaritaceae cyanobacterium C42_A2020_066]
MSAAEYVPKRGDIIYLDFNPTRGHEQRGRRPALVMSPHDYNNKTSLALLVPITSKRKGYPFEVVLPAGLKTQGVILADQLKCLDWRARHAQFEETLSSQTLREAQGKLLALLT